MRNRCPSRVSTFAALAVAAHVAFATASPCAQVAPDLLQTAAQAADQQTDQASLRYAVAGLEAPARIVVDTWGVPHIYAGTHYDAFFVQGFNAARDRLWQIDLWRRRGLGELAAVLGPAYVEQDTAARAFLFRGDLYREWLAYGNDAKQITAAFVAGINAYVALTEQHGDLLPPEFRRLGYRPARWAAADVVRIRSNGLWRNLTTEVQRARILCQLGAGAAAQWKVLEPAWQIRVPAGLDPCIVPDQVLDRYLLAKSTVRFGSGAGQLTASLQDAIANQASAGSNNWAVAPSRTTTGRPILADDPHRGHAVPSLRYIAHLKAPGLNVIGAGEPSLPGISIGHNERIGFGLTIFPIDQEDLYVYVRDHDGYLYRGEREALTRVEETIAIAGKEPRQVTLSFTRHGPVIFETAKHLFAVRAAWLEPGMAPYFGSIEYMRARNWREFVGALNRWGAPSENQVYADVDGNIGYKPAGLFPRRPNWDGLLPVPGDGRYEWDGFFDMDVLPQAFNPQAGYVSSANAMNLPPDYPIDRYPVGFEWSAPWRAKRLIEVLSADTEHSPAASEALQRDYRSLFAVRLSARLPRSDQPAVAMLEHWDGSMAADSAPAALFNLWLHRHLQPALAAAIAPAHPALLQPLDLYTVLAASADPAFQATLERSLQAAWEEAGERLGQDPSRWRWGDLHQMRFEHPLLAAGIGPSAAWQMPAYPRGGSDNTTNNTSFTADDLSVQAGASFRMVLDVGNWDAATMTNAPGQSGDPRSPFYSNLLQDWAEDGSFPLRYSDAAVAASQVLTIELQPRRAAPHTRNLRAVAPDAPAGSPRTPGADPETGDAAHLPMP